MAHLLIDAADVFAKQADAEQRDSDEEKGDAKECEQAFRFGANRNAPYEQEDDEQGRQKRNTDAQHREKLQRHQRKAGHQVEVEADQRIKRILGFPGVTFFMSHFDLGRILREGVGQGRNEGTDLTTAIDGVDDRPRVGAQHAALVSHFDPGDTLAQAVHGLRRPAAERRVLAVLTNTADTVITFAHLGDQFADFFRRILQVGIQRHHDLSARVLEAGHDRHVLSGVGCEQDGASHVGSLFKLRSQQGSGTVTAAIVDEDHFTARAQRVERRIEPVEERRQAGFFVVDGDDDRDFRNVHFLLSLMFSARAMHTRATSASAMPGKRGSVMVSRPTRSALGKSPSLKPSLR